VTDRRIRITRIRPEDYRWGGDGRWPVRQVTREELLREYEQDTLRNAYAYPSEPEPADEPLPLLPWWKVAP
jgi:hypothetical protein